MQRYDIFEEQINIFARTNPLPMSRFKSFMPVFLLVAFLVQGCGPQTPEYKKRLAEADGPVPELEFYRYEEVLFNLDTSRFQEELMAVQQQYLPFLGGDLTDSLAVGYLKDFVTDPMSVTLYRKVEQAFPDLSGVRALVEEVYRRFSHYYPEIPLPQRIYTCVSGIDPDLPPVMVIGDALVVSLDWYLEGDDVYALIGMPEYRSQRIAREGLAKDLGQQLYATYLQREQRHANLLEEMVEAGRMYFFVEAMDPSMPDDVLLGYTPSQLQWAEDFEGDLWADMVGSQCLYASDLEVYRTFLADGPFTNEYSHEAPPRLGEFIGLHIVRSYMEHHPEVSLPGLMGENDLQALFQDSRYKPKK